MSRSGSGKNNVTPAGGFVLTPQTANPIAVGDVGIYADADGANGEEKIDKVEDIKQPSESEKINMAADSLKSFRLAGVEVDPQALLDYSGINLKITKIEED